MANLTLEEMETSLYCNATDRGTWHVYSDDPVWQRRLEAAGATLVQETHGGGKKYTLRADQITFRKGKRVISDERKAQLAARLRAQSENTTVQGAENRQQAITQMDGAQ